MKKIALFASGAIGVLGLFKGMDYLTNKKGFDAEEWDGSLNVIPVAVDYFCASEVLKSNGIVGKKAVGEIRAVLMNKDSPFILFNRKQTKLLIDLINQRLTYYSDLYYNQGELSLYRAIEGLEIELRIVSSEEFSEYLIAKAFAAKLRGLPELPETNKERVRVRFAPNPNGPLSMGHSFGIIINDIYAKAYGGDYVLRFDDTDPDIKRPLAHLYPQIEDEFQFLTDRTPEEYELHIASDNRGRYIALARQLISEGKAYVSYIPHGTFSELYQRPMKSEGIPSPDRDKSIELNLKQFDEMVSKGFYTEEDGTVRKPTDNHLRKEGLPTTVPTVWLKTPLNSFGKFRDIKIMRATYRQHPNVDGYVWPFLAFQGAVDDYDLKISHMIRGCDLWETEIAYSLIWRELGWDLNDLPVFMYWPRLFFANFGIPYSDPETGEPKLLRAIGTSKMAKLVQLPEFGGNWCNQYFPTVCSYMAKGFPASYLRDFWMGEVWGKTLPFFNEKPIGEEGQKGYHAPLTKLERTAPIRMRIGEKSLGYYKNQQAQVPYPLDSEGNLRDAPSITLVDLEVGQPIPNMRVMNAED